MKVRFEDNFTPKKFKFVEKFNSWIPGTHKFLDKFPEPFRTKFIILGYRLGIIKAVGYVKIQPQDENGKPNGIPIIVANIIPDVGVTHIRDILAGTSSVLPSYIEFGTGTTPPIAGDTDVETPLDSLGGGGDKSRLSATVTTPGDFELRLEVFLSSTYGPTRPYTINNMGIFTHLTNTPIIAHALVSPGHTMTGTNTATATYGLLLR